MMTIAGLGSPRIRYIRGAHPLAIFLRALGGDGITTPWLTIYILATVKNLPSPVLKGLIRHEVVHIRQIQRDGQLRFWGRYCWWTITKGYAANPYELEAYAAQRAYLRRIQGPLQLEKSSRRG